MDLIVAFVLTLWVTNTVATNSLLPEWRECGISSSASRAMNDEDASDAVPAFLGQFPWTARIHFETWERRHRCLGTLISNRHVLTAASCVSPALEEDRVGKLYGGMRVRMGEHDLSSDPDCDAVVCAPRPHQIDVTNVTIHPLYKPFLYYDAAVLRLAKPLNFSDYVRPVCLPLAEHETSWASAATMVGNIALVMAGWNLRAPPASGTSLQAVRLPMVDEKACRRLYQDMFQLGDVLGLSKSDAPQILCAGAGDVRTSCFIDPGAALLLPFRHDAPDAAPYLKYVQVALTNSGLTCARPGLPGIFTRVDSVLPWILKSMWYP